MANRVHEKAFVGDSVNWLTPSWVIDALGGPFDLDPCGCDGQCETAKRIYRLPDEDGLMLPWTGSVFLNPPFGQENLPRWLNRMALHGAGIALVPARVDTRVWHKYIFRKADMVLFIQGRIQYGRGNGEDCTRGVSGCGFPSAIAAYGDDGLRRLRASGIKGSLMRLVEKCG